MKTPIYSFLLILITACPSLAQTSSRAKDDSLKKLSSEGRQLMLDQLHITTLRRGPDPAVVKAMNPSSPEGKQGLYGKLPDVLTLNNGEKVTNAKTWWEKRRPEIVEDFSREIYGRMPEGIPNVSWAVVSTTQAMHNNIPVIIKTLNGHVGNSIYPAINVNIQLVVTLPAQAKKPVPVMMELTFPEDWQLPDTAAGTQWKQQVLDKGWAYAMLLPVSFQADNGAGLSEGIIGLMNKGAQRKPGDWGALRAWAWGASRALDYMETDKVLDAKKVGLEGHSRYGKAVLVAMAYDQRFAMVYSSSSGEGGAKLNRHNMGEQVENICSTGAYHWMAGNFLKYAGPLHSTDMPVDAHELIALAAPRPVLIGGGANKDDWADAPGMFMAEVAASPVYVLLGKKGLETTAYPAVDEPLIAGDLAFRLHHGGHTPALNWPAYIEFAEKYWR